MTDESRRQQPAGSQDIDLLARAFDSFNVASDSLKKAYESLQRQVKELNLELKLKNAQLEENIRELESIKNYINNVLQSIHNGVVSVDLEGRITTFNNAASAMLGASEREAVALRYWQLFGEHFNLQEADGRILEIKPRLGDALQLSFNVSPLTEFDGRTVGYVISFFDVTRLKQLEAELQKNARLAAMGEMAANLAHEIRNPLGSIKLFASILERNLEGDQENTQIARHIMQTVDALDGSITNMLIYARSPEADFVELRIAPILDGAVESASYAISQGKYTVEKDYRDLDERFRGDPRFLNQALSNIIMNGLQAMPEGGTLRISTMIADLNDLAECGRSVVSSRAPYERYLAVRISDTGEGLAEKELTMIFEPFFSTKTMGTGLGLSIVKRVVQKHDGCLMVREPENGGLEFTVALPL